MLLQQQLLLPANPLFIWSSLVVAMVVNMLPLGRTPWMPDLAALVLVFWTLHQPNRIGLTVCFLMGLLMDAAAASLLGQYALTYVTVGFLTLSLRRRILQIAESAAAMTLSLRRRILQLQFIRN